MSGVKVWNGTSWDAVAAVNVMGGGGSLGSAVVSGGTETDDGTYQYNAFTSDGTLTVTTPGLVDVLIVGGGGGGGGYYSGGGGGGGGVAFAEDFYVDANVSVGVGAGGSGGSASSATDGFGTNGTSSTFGKLIGVGGGAGAGQHSGNTGGYGERGGSGGGGGSRNAQSGGKGITTQGNSGGASRTGGSGGTGAGVGGCCLRGAAPPVPVRRDVPAAWSSTESR